VEGRGRGRGPDPSHLSREARGRNPRQITRVDGGCEPHFCARVLVNRPVVEKRVAVNFSVKQVTVTSLRLICRRYNFRRPDDLRSRRLSLRGEGLGPVQRLAVACGKGGKGGKGSALVPVMNEFEIETLGFWSLERPKTSVKQAYR
jgi:hypothetical protein